MLVLAWLSGAHRPRWRSLAVSYSGNLCVGGSAQYYRSFQDLIRASLYLMQEIVGSKFLAAKNGTCGSCVCALARCRPIGSKHAANAKGLAVVLSGFYSSRVD